MPFAIFCPSCHACAGLSAVLLLLLSDMLLPAVLKVGSVIPLIVPAMLLVLLPDMLLLLPDVLLPVLGDDEGRQVIVLPA